MLFNRVKQFINAFKGRLSLFFELSTLDFNQRTSGTALGTFWAYFNPLISIGIIWFVFYFGFKVSSGKQGMYSLLIGLMSWQLITDSVTTGLTAFTEKPYLIKKIKFPLELLPIIKVVNSFRAHLPFIVLMIFISALSGNFSISNILLFVPVILMIFVLLSALIIVLASVVIFHRDIQNFIILGLQILFWGTPIIWSIPSEPKFISWVEYANPMYFVVSAYRFCFLNENDNMGIQLVVFTSYTVVATIISTKLFYKLRDQFADVL